jgi:hypothetical protein
MIGRLTESWFALARAERHWLLFRLLCSLVWAVELFCIQGLAFDAVPWLKHPVMTQCFRFGLDLLLTLSLVLLLQRRYLTPLLIFNLVALGAIGTYAANFHRPILPVRAYYQWREAWSLRSRAWEILSWRALVIVVPAFAAKLALLARSGNYAVTRELRWRTAGLMALLYVLPVAALQLTNMRFPLKPTESPGRVVFAYGYAMPWVADILASRNTEEHAAMARTYLDRHFDRISPAEAPLRIPGHLIILQLESVGGNAMEATSQGTGVMPFLSTLRKQSMDFRIRSFHKTGSCDMDYAATTFVEPYPNLVPYRLPGMKYTNSLPFFMGKHGYKTFFFHGNTGLFYDRSTVIEQLGFDHIFFKEELAPEHLACSIMGVRDAELFGCILKALQTEHRACVFAVTLDTHTPFENLTPGEMELFPHPTDAIERFFNTLRYLDGCLRKFFAQLPNGSTVVMYGDHTASFQSDRFTSDIVDGQEYVNCLINQKGVDLSDVQQTRHQSLALDGSLNLLDVMSYLRHSVEFTSQLEKQPPAAHAHEHHADSGGAKP